MRIDYLIDEFYDRFYQGTNWVSSYVEIFDLGI
jgi:hypothetical protein